MFRNPESTVEGRHYHIKAPSTCPSRSARRPPDPDRRQRREEDRSPGRPLADACNFFGDVPTIDTSSVLDDRCTDVGRDPPEITKTRLGAVVIGDTHEQAVAKCRGVARGAGSTLPSRSYIVGDADGVAEQVAALLDAGLDGMIFELSRRA